MSSSNAGYDVVVDVDDEGDLGHTDLTDLEFHQSTYTSTDPSSKPPTGRLGSHNNASSSGGPSNQDSSKYHMFSLPFYARHFDLDTSTLLARCLASLYPRASFLDLIDGNPDLYGPIWITTSVVLALFLSSTLQQYFTHWLSPDGHKYSYDFTRLSAAAGLMYGYTGLVPVALWGILKWLVSRDSNSESAGLVEVACLYGYANLVWVGVAVASVSPINILNWVFVGIGLALSATFLFRNLYPVVSATDHRTARVLLVVVVVAHAGLALAIKVLFFKHGSPVLKDGGKEEGGKMMMF